jgi:hypothetical protein
VEINSWSTARSSGPQSRTFATNDIWDHDGRHELRLSAAGTAAVISLVRKVGVDRVMADLELTDPIALFNLLLGHSELPTEVVIRLSQLLVAHRIKAASLG